MKMGRETVMELPIYTWNPDPKSKKGKKRTHWEENLVHLYRWLRKPVLPAAHPLASQLKASSRQANPSIER